MGSCFLSLRFRRLGLRGKKKKKKNTQLLITRCKKESSRWRVSLSLSLSPSRRPRAITYFCPFFFPYLRRRILVLLFYDYYWSSLFHGDAWLSLCIHTSFCTLYWIGGRCLFVFLSFLVKFGFIIILCSLSLSLSLSLSQLSSFALLISAY